MIICAFSKRKCAQADSQRYRQTDVQIYLHTDIQKSDIQTDCAKVWECRQTNRCTERQICKHKYLQYIHTDIQTGQTEGIQNFVWEPIEN
jgi:hypothetical protein